MTYDITGAGGAHLENCGVPRRRGVSADVCDLDTGPRDVRLYDATAVLPQAQLIALDAGLASEVIRFMGIRDTARIAPDRLEEADASERCWFMAVGARDGLFRSLLEAIR